jgi:hypothetical protein
VTESFLHYIWQFQYFSKEDLRLTDEDEVQIFHPGIRNTHAGPDFSDARIKIDLLEWRGSIEIHIKASGWIDHRHSADDAYEKVVLHVVWENDKPIVRTDGSIMPTLELKNRVDMNLWNRFKKLFTSVDTIPCANQWQTVPEITRLAMLDKAVIQRLESKADAVKALLAKNNGDWEETCYQLVCKNFGFKVNAEPMVQLANGLPYKVLLKHINSPIQVEALLLGQAGFLEKLDAGDAYAGTLSREYNLLRKKFNLEPKQMKMAQWRLLRLRPANFPAIRLAQFAALISSQKSLFSKILESTNVHQLVILLSVKQSDYWQQHYQLGKKAAAKVPALGKTSINNLLINTIAPVLTAYGRLHDDQSFVDRAVEILQHIPGENNVITRQWTDLGYKVKSAFDSQGLIELYNNFCLKRRCLECSVGSQIVSRP